jgi:hypothetical protein
MVADFLSIAAVHAGVSLKWGMIVAFPREIRRSAHARSG